MINDFCEAIMDYIADRMAVVFVGFALLCVGIIGLVFYAGVSESRSPILTLKKSEWECTGTRSESITTYVQSGKVMVPLTTYHDVCVEYQKR